MDMHSRRLSPCKRTRSAALRIASASAAARVVTGHHRNSAIKTAAIVLEPITSSRVQTKNIGSCWCCMAAPRSVRSVLCRPKDGLEIKSASHPRSMLHCILMGALAQTVFKKQWESHARNDPVSLLEVATRNLSDRGRVTPGKCCVERRRALVGSYTGVGQIGPEEQGCRVTGCSGPGEQVKPIGAGRLDRGTAGQRFCRRFPRCRVGGSADFLST
jgi:hypothetical protein